MFSQLTVVMSTTTENTICTNSTQTETTCFHTYEVHEHKRNADSWEPVAKTFNLQQTKYTV